jgi:hypothetical protein
MASTHSVQNMTSSVLANSQITRLDVLVAGPDAAFCAKITRFVRDGWCFHRCPPKFPPTDSVLGISRTITNTTRCGRIRRLSLVTDVERFESLDVELEPKTRRTRAQRVELRLWNAGSLLPGTEAEKLEPHSQKSLVDNLEGFISRTGLRSIDRAQLCVGLCFRPNWRKHEKWLDLVVR